MAELTVAFPDGLHDDLEKLVEQSQFKSRNEAVRYYVRSGLQREAINNE